MPLSQLPSVQLVREQLTKLFEFLKVYTDLRYPPIRDISQQLRSLWIKDLPSHSSVELFRDAGRKEEESEDNGVLLRLTRPTITQCPRPPAVLVDWLKHGWQEYPGTAAANTFRSVLTAEGDTRIERFEEDDARPSLFRRWQHQREEWIASERPARQALELFQIVYEWFGVQEREGERVELLIGDGFLRCKAVGGEFRHPVLLQKLELEFYPEKRQPQFVFRRRDQPPELYVELLQALPNVNEEQIRRCKDELTKAEFAPLGTQDTDGFLRRLIQGLFPRGGNFLDSNQGSTFAGSASVGEPTLLTQPQASELNEPTIQQEALIFMRQRRTGANNIFERILEDIASREVFPLALLQILGLAESESRPPEIPSGLCFGNEDAEILLSKLANREQLEIAKQLARRDTVLVQGPPGTGKTHTIANLLGHLLAQGKRVLVTAHTPKALRVLRQKVVEPLRPLCISVLHNDKQSQDELQDSVRKIHVRLSGDDRLLERDALRLRQERAVILDAIRKARQELLDARQDEIRDLVFGGRAIHPIDAAKQVRAGVGTKDWIPAPVSLGEALPLSPAELVALYQTNARLTLDDERELARKRPDLSTLPTPNEFKSLIDEMNRLAGENLRVHAELWDADKEPDDLAEFDRMHALANNTIEFFRDNAPWQLQAVQAGRDGGTARRVWDSLITLIEETWHDVNECYSLVIEYGPTVNDARSAHELLSLTDEIIEHIEAGGSFGLLTKLTKRHWFDFIDNVRIAARPVDLSSGAHFRAVRALLQMQLLRQQLIERWERLMSCQGAPASSELSDRPEQVCMQFVTQISNCLEWHAKTWQPLEVEFQRLGFKWSKFLESTAPETGADAALRRIRNAVTGELGTILESRSGWLRYTRLQEQLVKWRKSLAETSESEATSTRRLRKAMRDNLPGEYSAACEDLTRLTGLEQDLTHRRGLLNRLSRSSPAWASAIESRLSRHDQPEIPGDPTLAWEWRQLHDELEKRAAVSLEQLQQQIETLSEQLMKVTTDLVEKQTWMNQIRQTSAAQKNALGAYAAMRKKLTKTGKGVRDADMRAAARREMAVAKDAVPVWIMPLAEVAETFDPRTTRFDVVIIDEASQCDPTSMFALYLGNQTIVVGDDEQVSPVAAGVDMNEVSALIRVYLQAVPFKELYDGTTSIYDLAQISFGGVIRLTEHFRCAPNIIAFSNQLSYGDIKPLRETSSIPLHPHVVHHRVQGGRDRADNVNEVEAETIASLIHAAIQQPEYANNEFGEPVSFGVISLVGAHQAIKIDTLLKERIEPAEYKRRQILCGDSANFQGDERDVMFISVVDAPPANPPMSMRQEGPKRIFKKRFNVAASRARNQMWIVHSLNHETDLQPGDYRRLLIEHALDPEAWERELRKRLQKTESVFEERVLTRLMQMNYNVVPQFLAGAYRIDLVVSGNGRRLAIECDGERFHGTEQLQEDIERQAILERLGWKFVRIRGSLFFRDEERALEPVFRRLHELGIGPGLNVPSSVEPAAVSEVVQRIISRAQELRSTNGDDSSPPSESAAPHQDGQAVTRESEICDKSVSVSEGHASGQEFAQDQLLTVLLNLIPISGPIRREELLQKVAEHFGVTTRSVRRSCNQAISAERNAGRLRLDPDWEVVWRP